MPESPYPMIPIEKAIAIVLEKISPLPPIEISFADALGLVLAEDVIASEALPPFPASTVDGFALRSADSGVRKIVGAQMAGEFTELRVRAGEAARVTTGAPIPDGADAMVMVEDTIEKNERVEITAPVLAGDNIRPIASDIAVRETILSAGSVLNPAEIGLLATVGKTTVRVFPRPKVGVMSTGDELLEPHEKLAPGKIRDANRFSLMNAVRQAGGIPINLGIVRDETGGLEKTIARGLATADMLVTSGGVSMGQLDLVKPYLAKHGELFFGRMLAKPGKPTSFGILQGKPFFALAGNPVSAMVGFENLVRTSIRKMMGRADIHRPRRKVTLENIARHTADRTEFQRAIVTRHPDGSLTARTTGGQQSSRLISMRGINAFIILPHGQDDFPAGMVVEVMLLSAIGD